MARPKKVEGATLTIDVDSFVRTRDSVVTGLATLQDAIQTLSTAYIKHTNAILNEHGQGIDVDAALARLGENPLMSFAPARAASPAKLAAADANDKKERKKRQHDPNAPKRPLTPFFLYMQTARPIIAADLGADVAKGAVSVEGTRRWGAMLPDDKQLWTNAYKDNLRLYNARMHSYKLGNLLAKDMSDQEAAHYADAHAISNDASADAHVLSEHAPPVSAIASTLLDEDAEGEPEREPTPPPKTPKGKARKGKATKNTPAMSTPVVQESIVPPASASSSIMPKASEKSSPEKKRKRTGGKKSDEVVVEEVAKVETPKSAPKPRKKAKKADS